MYKQQKTKNILMKCQLEGVMGRRGMALITYIGAQWTHCKVLPSRSPTLLNSQLRGTSMRLASSWRWICPARSGPTTSLCWSIWHVLPEGGWHWHTNDGRLEFPMFKCCDVRCKHAPHLHVFSHFHKERSPPKEYAKLWQQICNIIKLLHNIYIYIYIYIYT